MKRRDFSIKLRFGSQNFKRRSARKIDPDSALHAVCLKTPCSESLADSKRTFEKLSENDIIEVFMA